MLGSDIEFEVTRFELIDHTKSVPERGRIFSKYADAFNKLSITLYLQDDGRTLKVFLKDLES